MSISDKLAAYELRMYKEDMLAFIARNAPWTEDDVLFLVNETTKGDESRQFRIAWLIEHILAPGFLLEESVSAALTQQLCTTANASVRRHFAKILALGNCSDSDLDRLVDFSFRKLMDPGEKVAVKVHLIELILKGCNNYPELIAELRDSLQLLQQTASSALKARTRMVFKKLDRLENNLSA